MRPRLVLAVLLLSAALGAVAGSGCGGGGARCCMRFADIPAGVRYRATIGNPDGGAPTLATVTRFEDGGATLTFDDGRRRVEVHASATRN